MFLFAPAPTSVYEYGEQWTDGSHEDTRYDITSKTETVWRFGDDGKWFRKYENVTDYGYQVGQLYRVNNRYTDVCPDYCGGVCDETCTPSDLSTTAEYHMYDRFGRRIAHNVCHGADLEETEANMFAWCKSEAVMYDYAGLSHQVIAERSDPYIVVDGTNPAQRRLVGDRYLSTYTYGPLGLISRTAEFSNADPADNRVHYYLSDAMGGNIGLYVDDDGDPGTDRVAVFQQFDAFGNDMSKPLFSTRSFAWRGQEGSVTDRDSGLVYMQARHYDPSIGRFIQADALPVASLTTQGMNRYAYCENDPVSQSDPSGRSFNVLWQLTGAILAITAGATLVGDMLRLAGTLAWAFGADDGIVCQLRPFDLTDPFEFARFIGALAVLGLGLALIAGALLFGGGVLWAVGFVGLVVAFLAYSLILGVETLVNTFALSEPNAASEWAPATGPEETGNMRGRFAASDLARGPQSLIAGRADRPSARGASSRTVPGTNGYIAHSA